MVNKKEKINAFGNYIKKVVMRNNLSRIVYFNIVSNRENIIKEKTLFCLSCQQNLQFEFQLFLGQK